MSRRNRPSPTARDRAILKEVIGLHLLTGEPVSSRSVAKLERQGLSAATIRNVMADLEEEGYLSQPHTSAGRVPTGLGYHLYIESLMPNRSVSAQARSYIEDHLAGARDDGEHLMSAASRLLSELSHMIGIVVTPAIGDTTLKAINFVPISGSKVHCFLVSSSGFVDNKVIQTPAEMSLEQLIRISNYLTDNFAGKTVREIRDHILSLMIQERAEVDELLSQSIALAREALFDASKADLLVEGTAEVLNQPELSNVDRVRRLLDTFADRARVVNMLNQLLHGEGVRVVIGDESDLTSELDFSLVATSYGAGGRQLGTLGVFGPSRMDYPTVIPLVNFLGQRLSEALEETFEIDRET